MTQEQESIPILSNHVMDHILIMMNDGVPIGKNLTHFGKWTDCQKALWIIKSDGYENALLKSIKAKKYDIAKNIIEYADKNNTKIIYWFTKDTSLIIRTLLKNDYLDTIKNFIKMYSKPCFTVPKINDILRYTYRDLISIKDIHLFRKFLNMSLHEKYMSIYDFEILIDDAARNGLTEFCKIILELPINNRPSIHLRINYMEDGEFYAGPIGEAIYLKHFDTAKYLISQLGENINMNSLKRILVEYQCSNMLEKII